MPRRAAVTWCWGSCSSLSLGASIELARVLDARRPALRALVQDEVPYQCRRRLARQLSLGFSGLAADWYWL